MDNIIINTWYPEDEKYQKWWFQSKFNEKNKKIIKNIVNVNKNNNINWYQNSNYIFSGILYYDQFYRHLSINTYESDKKAVELCLYGVQHNLIPKEPHYLVFFLLPLRHTKKTNFIEYSIRLIKFKINHNNNGHYRRFLKNSINSLKDLEENKIDTWLDWIDQYRDILCDKVKYTFEKDNKWIYQSNAWKTFIDFINNHNIKSIIISLSGGVDSMVFLYLCYLYKNNNQNFNFYAVHINWNQREESCREAEFLKYYLTRINITFLYKNIKDMDRSKNRKLFEENGKKIRFDLYKEAIKKWNCKYVFLGHHNGDIIENVFTNMIHGKNVLDMGKMTSIMNIEGVNIIRPFLNINKDDIYDVARKELIPYFKNTTPDWSNRGFIRNNIFPQMDNHFGKTYKNGFNTIAKKTREIGDMINECLIEPYMNKIIYNNNIVLLPYNNNYPRIFYEIMFEKLMYKLKKKKFSNKSISSWFNHTRKGNNWGTYMLKKDCKITLENINTIKIVFT